MSYFEEEDDVSEGPDSTDLLLFNEHFAGLASPYATHLYGCLLRVGREQNSRDIVTRTSWLSQKTTMTGLRIDRAIEELVHYGAILHRRQFGGEKSEPDNSYLWLNIPCASSWRPTQDCRDAPNGQLPAVYVLQYGEKYKIGSSRQWQKRTHQIGRTLTGQWSVFHTISCDQPGRLERYWHLRFFYQRVDFRGEREWFALEEPQLRWLKYLSIVHYRSGHAENMLSFQHLAYVMRFEFKDRPPETWDLSVQQREYCEKISLAIWG